MMKQELLQTCIRTSVVLVLLLLVYSNVSAQNWAVRHGSTDEDKGVSIAHDAAGNVYVTGYFSGTVTFGNISLISSGFSDIFVVKYDSSGAVEWAVRHGGSDSDLGNGIAVDGSGNVYVTGEFQGSATFGNTTLTSSGLRDIFVVKYNSSGIVQWAQRHGGTSNDFGYGIATDGNSNVYVTGSFPGTATFGNTTLTSSGESDIFVVKYNSSGIVQWAQRHGGITSDYGISIAVDGSSNVYVTGHFSYSASFGNTTLTGSGFHDIFVVKYNTNGVVQWAQRAGSTDNEYGHDIAVDSSGNVYVTGVFLSSVITFGSTTLTNNGSQDIFVVKYNTNGVVQWAQGHGGITSDYGQGIAVDGSGNVYVTGALGASVAFGSTTLKTNGVVDVYVVKYNTFGTLQWAQLVSSSVFAFGDGITVDDSNNVYVTGYFQRAATFGSATLVISGGSDIFVMKYASSSVNTISGVVNGVSNEQITVNIVQNGRHVTSATTTTGGLYNIPNLSNGTYVVIPSRVGTSFTPEIRVVTVSNATVTNQNFTAGCATAQIVGESKVGYGGVVPIRYYTNDYVGGSYTWSAVGGTITSGQGSRSVEVVWSDNATNRTISVSGNNTCGNYTATKNVSVSSLVRELPIAVGGVVQAVAVTGNTLYIGGNFSSVGPKTGSGVAISTSTGQVEGHFPIVNGAVWASIPDGAGGFYIGGDFTNVGGEIRNRLARINADGTLHTWNPNANHGVRSLVFGNGVVYAGGYFSSIDGQSRNNIAAIDIVTGQAISWNPNANNLVSSLAAGNGVLYVSGDFTSIGGASRNRIAALDIGTGQSTSWNANANNSVSTLFVSNGVVFAGGSFTSIGGQSRQRIAALDMATGQAISWAPNASGEVLSLTVDNGFVYVGGEFSSIGGYSRNRIAALQIFSGLATSWNPNASSTVRSLSVVNGVVYACGSFTSIGGQNRNRIAALDIATGQATSWNPNASNWVYSLAFGNGMLYAGGDFSSIGGVSRNYIAAIDMSTGQATSWNPNANSGVRSLAFGNGVLYAGGEFSSIGGVSRNYIAAIDMSTGQATSWNPNANSWVLNLAVGNGMLYAGGTFTSIGSQSRNRIAALDMSTGQSTSWNPNASSTVYSLSVGNGVVYAGGEFSSIGGQSRNNIAALNIATGQATSWNPNANSEVRSLALGNGVVYAGGNFTSIGGASRNRLVALDMVTGQATSWNPNSNSWIYSLAVGNEVLYAGGGFSSIGGMSRNCIAALDVVSGQATSWNSNASNTVSSLAMGNGVVYAGGYFTSMDGVFTGGLAVLRRFDVPQETTLTLRTLMQGLWNGSNHTPTPIAVELRSGGTTVGQSVLVTRATAMVGSTGWATVPLSGVATGSYWLVVRHGGSLPVGSAQPISITAGGSHSYNFSTSANTAHSATALVQEGNDFLLRMGDINGDRQKGATDNTNIQAAPGFNMSFGGNAVPLPVTNATVGSGNGIVLSVRAYMEGFWNGSTHVPTPVAIELRSGGSTVNGSSFVHVATGMLSSSGEVTVFYPSNIPAGQYWIVVRHGGHLPVGSSSAVNLSHGNNSQYNFTTAATQAHSATALLQHSGGAFMLRVGDINGDRQKNATDNTFILNAPGFNMSFGGNLIPAP